MKKYLTWCLLAGLLAAVPLAAQVDFGLGPGVQYSGGLQYPLDAAYHRYYFTSAMGSALVDVPLAWKFSLMTGVQYSNKAFNATVVYSGAQHLSTPAKVVSGEIEVPLLLVVHPVRFFHVGGGLYGSQPTFRRVYYAPLVQVTPEEAIAPRCKPKPPPAIPLGSPVMNADHADAGYMAVAGFSWLIKCPTITYKNSIEFAWSRGLVNVFTTYGRRYRNETLSCSYVWWF